MNIVRLGDVATYINGYAFKPSDWSDVGMLIIRIQNLTGNKCEINRYNGNYDKKYEVNFGDILISWSASLGVYIWKGEKAVLNQHIFKVVLNKLDVDKLFFAYQAEKIIENAKNKVHGATMKHLTKPIFESLPFYLPPLEEQKRIANILDKVTELIQKRKQQLDKLDLLVKAKFVEMFGDPSEENETVNITKKMNDICTIIDGDRGKNYPKQDELLENGFCLFLNTKNVLSKGFCFDNCTYITEEKDNILNKGKLLRGDIVLTTRGTIGNLAFYDDNVPFDNIRINSGMVILRLKKQLINEIFFIEQFRMKLSIIKEKIVNGTAQPQLPISKMNYIQIILPPIELQEQFAKFVEETEKSKIKVNESLEKLEPLKKALMQEYFN